MLENSDKGRVDHDDIAIVSRRTISRQITHPGFPPAAEAIAKGGRRTVAFRKLRPRPRMGAFTSHNDDAQSSSIISIDAP